MVVNVVALVDVVVAGVAPGSGSIGSHRAEKTKRKNKPQGVRRVLPMSVLDGLEMEAGGLGECATCF